MFPSFSVLAIVLCHLSKSTYAQKELPSLNRVVGSTVVLQPGSVDGVISSVTWKHNNDLAVECFEGDEPEYYREFKKHASLNKPVGVLTIEILTAAFSGTYTVEINNKVISSQKLQVFDPVPKPTISVTKVTETSYVLTCNSHVNDAAQLVQVKWIIDDEETSEKSNNLTINEGSVSRSFVCLSTNPVSNKSSDAVTNPFDSGNPGFIIGIVVAVIIFLAVLAFLSLVVRPPPLLKDKPAVKSLRDSSFGKGIRSACSCLTAPDQQQQPNVGTADETGENNEGVELMNNTQRNEAPAQQQQPNVCTEDKLMNNSQPTGGTAQHQQLIVRTDVSANEPAAQGKSNHNLNEESAPEEDQN